MKQSDIYKLHQKYSHGSFKEKMVEIVWTHSLIVKSIALQIAEKLEKEYGIKTDKKLIEFGALIHDIGYYGCFDDDYKKICLYVLHGKKGFDILLNEKVSKKRARFALCHIGVGLSKEQIEKDKLDLPLENLIPISLEEEIVAYADSFHTKGHPSFGSFEESLKEVNGHNEKYGSIYERFRDKFGVPELKDLKEKYNTWHKEINEWIESRK
jgi:uncharacterized protein